MKNTELLSPAGDFECFQSALKFGADAIYLAGEEYGMRTSSANFDHDTLKKQYHLHTKRVLLYMLLAIQLHEARKWKHFQAFLKVPLIVELTLL